MSEAPATPPTTVGGDEWQTQGRTTVATRSGYQFHPTNKDLPVITPEGVNMTAAEADEVLAEAASTHVEDLAHRVTTEKDGE